MEQKHVKNPSLTLFDVCAIRVPTGTAGCSQWREPLVSDRSISRAPTGRQESADVALSGLIAMNLQVPVAYATGYILSSLQL